MAIKLLMPTVSWPVLKRIIRAYAEVHEAANPTVEEVAELAALQRTVVSSNNNFLREIGLLATAKGENKLTELGLKLAQSLGLENEPLVIEALQEMVRANPGLNQFVAKVRARGSLKLEQFRGEISIAAGISDKSKQPGAVKAIVDLLQEAKLIQVDDDSVRSTTPFRDAIEGVFRPLPENTTLPTNENRIVPSTGSQAKGIPFALGPLRLVHVQLPEDWNGPKDLPKLLKLMQIALGDSEAD